MGILHEEKSFCKKGTMSVCVAENWSEQKTCKYYEPATQANRCMYWIFDEYCDCLKAQIDNT